MQMQMEGFLSTFIFKGQCASPRADTGWGKKFPFHCASSISPLPWLPLGQTVRGAYTSSLEAQLGEQDLPIYHNKRYPNNYFLPYIEEEPTVN